jgi:hypothetical protein
MRRMLIAGVAALAVAAGMFFLGRASVGQPSDRYQDGYLSGVTAGRAEGVGEGRALQEGSQLPASAQQPVRTAFSDGYAAGTNDAFGGFDGGWSLGTPYVITLVAGTHGVTYRIDNRTELTRGVSYYLCPDGRTLCRSPR